MKMIWTDNYNRSINHYTIYNFYFAIQAFDSSFCVIKSLFLLIKDMKSVISNVIPDADYTNKLSKVTLVSEHIKWLSDPGVTKTIQTSFEKMRQIIITRQIRKL